MESISMSRLMPKSRESVKRLIKTNSAVSAFNHSLSGMAFWMLLGFHDAAVLASLMKLSGIACNCISGRIQKKYSKILTVEEAIEISFRLEQLNLFFYGLGNIVICYNFILGMIMLCIGRIIFGFYDAYTGIKMEHIIEHILEPGASKRSEWSGDLRSNNATWTTIGTCVNMGAFWYMDAILGMTGVQPYHTVLIIHGVMVAVDLIISVLEYNVSKVTVRTLERNR